jgi:signal transduction histidine kinase
VLARKPVREKSSAVRDLVLTALAICAVLLGAVLFAAGPIVERVRRLTSQVRRSAVDNYESSADVQGSDEITDLAQTFNAAAEQVRTNVAELEAREKALRKFLENTTHDVMIPLTVLQGHLTALRRKSESGEPVEHAVVVDALQEAHYMASLIENLATVARLEGGAPELVRHPVDLVALVERAVGRHRPIARAREIHLEHAVPPSPVSTSGDVTLIEQAVSNLIHNAVRYVQPGGHVAVVLAERGAEFSLRVLDDGPGVPESLRNQVFERSFRTDDARSRHPSGMGLGLSIARDVALRHGFTLALREAYGGGAELELRGPMSAPPAATA